MAELARKQWKIVDDSFSISRAKMLSATIIVFLASFGEAYQANPRLVTRAATHHKVINSRRSVALHGKSEYEEERRKKMVMVEYKLLCVQMLMHNDRLFFSM